MEKGALKKLFCFDRITSGTYDIRSVDKNQPQAIISLYLQSDSGTKKLYKKFTLNNLIKGYKGYSHMKMKWKLNDNGKCIIQISNEGRLLVDELIDPKSISSLLLTPNKSSNSLSSTNTVISANNLSNSSNTKINSTSASINSTTASQSINSASSNIGAINQSGSTLKSSEQQKLSTNIKTRSSAVNTRDSRIISGNQTSTKIHSNSNFKNEANSNRLTTPQNRTETLNNKKDKNRGWILWVIVILIILILTFGLIWMFRSNILFSSFSANNNQQTEQTEQTDSNIENEVVPNVQESASAIDNDSEDNTTNQTENEIADDLESSVNNSNENEDTSESDNENTLAGNENEATSPAGNNTQVDENVSNQNLTIEPEIIINQSETLYFLPEDSTLLFAAQATLIDLVPILNSHSKLKVTIEGHCANYGTKTEQIELSRRRAEAVNSFLISSGWNYSDDTVNILPLGAESPVSLIVDEESLNRRVVIIITSE